MKKNMFWMGYIPTLAMVILLVLVAAIVGSKTVTVFSENAKVDNRHCIVIDAGHGGEDGGATSCTGILESAFNLEFALRLEPIFRLLGYPTKMVRRADNAIHTQGETIAARKASDLKARVRLANETENAVLLSIHQNYFSESKYSGAQVFYSKIQGSEAIAKALQTAFRETINPGSQRREKKATGVYVMEHVTCPAVLIECGFLSNPDEEANLRTAQYQKKMCCVIAVTVANHFAS